MEEKILAGRRTEFQVESKSDEWSMVAKKSMTEDEALYRKRIYK